MNILLFATIALLILFAGKSCFGIYVLLRRISESQDVIYALATLTPVHFHANVASLITDEDIMDRDRTHRDNPSMRRWVLIEPGLDKGAIRCSLLHSSVYRVAFISPNEERLSPLVSVYGLKLWVMSLWTEPELVRLYVQHALAYGCETLTPTRLSNGLFSDRMNALRKRYRDDEFVYLSLCCQSV